jgi:hypothetical protein
VPGCSRWRRIDRDLQQPGRDLERTAEILGPDWQANGIAGNQTVIDAFCEEMHAQGITRRRIPTPDVFARFEELMAATSAG